MIKVNEDPVRQAARSAMANLLDPLYDDENEAGRAYIDELRDALAKPVPPSLTYGRLREAAQTALDGAKRDGSGPGHEWRIPGYLAICLREAVADVMEVQVCEDPVRQAARAVVEATWRVGFDHRGPFGTVVSELEQALAKPVPPSLTEDERKTVSVILGQWDKSLPASRGFLDALESAREKLS